MAPIRPTLALLAAIAGLVAPGADNAETRALLIGVGSYTGLPAEYRMTAPSIDTRLLTSALIAAGLDKSTVMTLSDGDANSGTRTAILAAISTLEAQASSGDRVLLYFSGHGGQRAATYAAREPDGLEEVWLASDARVSHGGQLEGGYVADHEILGVVDRLTRKGANVWLVVDACYAAGVTRGGEGDAGLHVKTVPSGDRRDLTAVVDPGFLDLPAPSAGLARRGQFTAFYASGAGSLALASDDGSVFTKALVRAIDSGRTDTLRDLAAAVLSVDAHLGQSAPRPVFEGDLDQPVLNLTRPGPRRFGLRRIRDAVYLSAGGEEGVQVGDSIQLEDAEGQPRGEVTVVETGLGRSRLAEGVPEAATAARLVAGRRAARSPAGRVLAAIESIGGRWSRETLDVTARLERPEAARCEEPVDPEKPGSTSVVVSLAALPVLRTCDRLFIRLENLGPTPLDVSVLYLAADGTVTGPSLHPLDEVRIRPGDHRDVAFRMVGESSDVTERLALIAVPAASRFPLDLRYLAGSTSAAESPERGADWSWWADTLQPEHAHRGHEGPAPQAVAVAVAFPVRVASMTEKVR